MGVWLESYNQLSEEQQDRVQRWLHLNKFISQTLKIPWEKWVEAYLQPCMDKPLDYSFMQVCFPGFTGMESSSSFSAGDDLASKLVAKVPLRAQNNLGRLSPELQDAIAAMLESDAAASAALLPADVVQLQKIFPREKALATLKKKDFRRLSLARDGDDLAITLDDGEDVLRVNVLEFGAVMRKPLP